MHDVKLADFQIVACNPVHQISANVAGDDVPAGSDSLRKPLRQ
jgi:hypothetical protein